MIVLQCPECGSSHIKIDQKKQERAGRDWLKCENENCNKSFLLSKASYREESNVYED